MRKLGKKIPLTKETLVAYCGNCTCNCICGCTCRCSSHIPNGSTIKSSVLYSTSGGKRAAISYGLSNHIIIV